MEADMFDRINEIVRVAVNNNFNCTKKEYAQLDELAQEYPRKLFFTNSNVKTPLLLDINRHPYKAVITLNPDITVDETLIENFYELDPFKIPFVRIKYVPLRQDIKDLIQEISSEGYTTVITLQRFNGKKGLFQYVPEDKKDLYKYDHSRFRLHGDALKEIHKIADSTPNTYICDRKDVGCGGCGLCSKLTIGRVTKISSLNMSSSGECPFDCVDCYAKTMQNILKKFERNHIVYDVIKQNVKQAGLTKHIKHAKKALRKAA